MWISSPGKNSLEGSVAVITPSRRDGKRIATGDLSPLSGEARAIKLWDAATGRELLSLKPPPSLAGLAFSPDGHRLLLQSSGSEIQVWDATPREATKQ